MAHLVKRMSAVLAGLVVLLALFAAVPAGAEEGGSGLVVFADEPASPYVFGELGGTAQGGITVEILTEMFTRLGREFEIRLMPWARVLKTVKHGRADAVPLLMKTPEREEYLVYTDYVVENRELFYYRPDSLGDFQWRDYGDLQGFTLGLVRDYTYGESFLEALAAYRYPVVYSPDNESCFRKLLAGRVDLILQDETMANAILSEHPEWGNRLGASEKPVTTYEWYMGISRLSPLAGEVDEINRILSDMRADGSLARILGTR